MTRRKLLKALGWGLAGAGSAGVGKSAIVRVKTVQPTQPPPVFKPGSREQLVQDLFEKDPVKALSLARTFITVDPSWGKEREFVQLAIGPFGKYVANAPDKEFDKSDIYMPGWKRP